MKITDVESRIVEIGNKRKATYLLIPAKVGRLFDMVQSNVKMDVLDDNDNQIIITIRERK